MQVWIISTENADRMFLQLPEMWEIVFGEIISLRVETETRGRQLF